MTNHPNETQVGGRHYYTGGLQHWDIVHQCYMNDYFAGNISKYLCRWKVKGGLEDLYKAQHYLAKAVTVWPNTKHLGTHGVGTGWTAMRVMLEQFITHNTDFDDFQCWMLRRLFDVIHLPDLTRLQYTEIQDALAAYILAEEDQAAEPTSAYVNQ